MRSPRLGILGQLDDLLWKLPGGHRGKARPFENNTKACPHGHPNLLEVNRSARVLGCLGAKPTDLRERAVQGTDDLRQSDICRLTRQAVTAFRAPLTGHDACSPQVRQDGAEKSRRNPLLVRQCLGGRRLTGDRQGQQGANAVINLGWNMH